MKERRIWELQPFTVCVILGLAFDEVEMRKIFRMMKVDDHLTESEMHEILSHVCTFRNPISRYIDDLLRNRFEKYRKRIGEFARRDTCLLIERREAKDVPLPALIWFAVQDHGAAEERYIFSAVHIQELRALRFYDALSRALPDGNPEDVLDVLEETSKANRKLRRRCDRLEQKNEELSSEIEALRREKSRPHLESEEQKKLIEQLKKECEEIGGDKLREEISNMKKVISLLTEEIKVMAEELLRRDGSSGSSQSEGADRRKTLESEEKLSLEGMKMAYIGGIESLVPYYRRIAESFGCDFYYRCGRSLLKKEVRSLVDKVDVVLCPVDMNSHNVCRYVKKICKSRDKPCYFLRSSGLSTLRREMIRLAEKFHGKL